MDNFLIDDGAKLYYISDFTIMDKPPESDDPVIANLRKKSDKDLLWLKSVFITSDARNGNGDGFKKDDLIKAAESIVLKPVNWKHNSSENIGVIAAKELKDKADGSVEMSIIAALWQGTPEARAYADKAKRLFIEGKLAMSMEALADNVECSECGETMPRIKAGLDPYGHYCDHLKNRQTNGATRWVKDSTLIGGGLLPTDEEKPADQTAWVKEVAKLHNEGGVYMNPIYTQEQFDVALEAKTSKLQTKIDEYQTKVADLEGSILAKDADIEVKVSDVETITTEKADWETKMQALTDELNTLKEAQVTEARTKELVEAGVEVSDDIKAKLVSMTDEMFELLKTVSEQKKIEVDPVKAAQFKTMNDNKKVSVLESAISLMEV